MPHVNRKSQPAPPAYVVEPSPGGPHIEVLRFGRAETRLPGVHTHAGLAIAYFDADGGELVADGKTWHLGAGDLLIVGPGQVYDATGLSTASGWGIFFSPDAVPRAKSGLLTWRTHPMLRPFVTGQDPDSRRFAVPADERAWWSAQCARLGAELEGRRPGYQEAATALLTLLLVAVGRLGTDLAAALAINDEPLLAEVFDQIDRRFHEGLSLRDVAAATHLTPGHLTTIVRRKTGLTVQAWIIERRMAEARQLLAATDLSIDEVSERVGYEDSPYFVRQFKREHSTTPLSWRRAARRSSDALTA
jgi:AraC-like DNA-binding protein